MHAVFAWLLTVLLLCGVNAARAQSPLAALTKPAATTPKPAAPAAPSLSPQETRQILDLLNDPQKRAAFTATLETLNKAVTVTEPPKPAAPVPLAPDSVGAQVIDEGGNFLTRLAAQFTSFGRVLGNLPALWVFSVHTWQDPALRARVLDAALHLAAVLGAAGLAEWVLALLLRRPVRTLARLVPAAVAESRDTETPTRDAAEDPPASDELVDAGIAEAATDLTPAQADVAEQALRHRRFASTVRALRRLPFILAAFVLDVLPLGLFLGIGYAGMSIASPLMQDVLETALLAYGACRAATCIMRLLVSPEHPALRLIHVSDAGAGYGLAWIRWLFATAAFGYAASTIGQMFGLPAQANQAFIKTISLLVHLYLIVIVLQCRRSVAARIRSSSPKPGFGASVRNRLASIWHLVAIFYIAGLWIMWAAGVRHGYVRIWHIFLITAGVLVAARLVVIVLLGGLDRAFRDGPNASRRTGRYYPALRRTVSTFLLVLTGLALLQAWGIDTLAWFRANALGGRLATTILTILIAAAAAITVWEATNASLDTHLAKLNAQAQYVKSARLRTLLPILRTVMMSTLVAIFGLTALSQIGVDIGPLLAGAGILGVAIGFGSQKLVQDFITGIFLLLENAMQVGDWVTVAGLSGTVENLSIRTMKLRAGDGSVHIIPFSSVSTVTNINRGIGNAAVSVSVPIEEDTDRVSEVLSGIARAMRGEQRFSELMRSDLQLWGIDKVDSGIVTIVGQIVCTDSGRWAVQREFNRRLTIKFKELGLRIATPVQTVYNYEAQARAAVAHQNTREIPTGQVTESPPPAALGNTN